MTASLLTDPSQTAKIGIYHNSCYCTATYSPKKPKIRQKPDFAAFEQLSNRAFMLLISEKNRRITDIVTVNAYSRKKPIERWAFP